MGLGELVNLLSSKTSGDWGAAVQSSSAHSCVTFSACLMYLMRPESRVTVMFQSLSITMDPFFSSTTRGTGLNGELSMLLFGCLI